MRLISPLRILAVATLALTTAGCASRSQAPSYAAVQGDDDAYCKANAGQPGSTEFANCLKNRDVQRGNAIVRADRAQRNLGEYMLNNSDKPGYMAR